MPQTRGNQTLIPGCGSSASERLIQLPDQTVSLGDASPENIALITSKCVERFLPGFFTDEDRATKPERLNSPRFRNQIGCSFPSVGVEGAKSRVGPARFDSSRGRLGLFGHGVLSSASLGNGGLHLRYERFERVQRPTTIRLRISPTMGQTASIFIARSYLDAIRIERIMPQPEKTEASARGLIYHFPVKGGPITITFHLEIEQFGVVSGEIGLIDGPTISFNQFVYP